MRANKQPPKHGGDLRNFCNQYAFTESQVLDLSTGISPWSWPVPDVPEKVWKNLPYGNFDLNKKHSDLVEAASRYYQCAPDNLIAVAGSQAAIEVLPGIAAPESEALAPVNGAKEEVLVPCIGYAEHEFNWHRKGHTVSKYLHLDDLVSQLQSGDAKYAVVINPNNPGTEQYAPKELLTVAGELGKRGGFLIVDEAFADASPAISLAPYSSSNPVIVLRSIGKFFGLAGLRLGFAMAPDELLAQLKTEVGLWSVNNAGHWLGARMLSDSDWISGQRRRLKDQSIRLYSILQKQLPELNWKRSATFVSGFGTDERIAELERLLAQSGIMVRRFRGRLLEDGSSKGSALNNIPSIVRIGLADEAGIHRLESAIAQRCPE